jgi:hypothetical protein
MHNKIGSVFTFLYVILLVACNKEVLDPISINTSKSPFMTTPGTLLSMKYPKDANGFFHVPMDTTMSYSRFDIYVEATKVIPAYRYNGTSVIVASFDCDSYWIISNSLAVTIPLYNPFTSLSSNAYFTTRLPVKDTTIILSQFKNYIVPIVQSTSIYLKDYFGGSLYKPADEYTPTDTATRAWSKRIIGPIPQIFKGDTIKVYGYISWDLGQYSIDHPELSNKLDSIKIIFK